MKNYLVLIFNILLKFNKIVIDEAHLAIDRDNPAALNFIYQMVKRIHKYKLKRKFLLLLTTPNIL